MKKKTTLLVVLICILTLSIFAFAACTPSNTTEPQGGGEVTINPATLELEVGGNKTISTTDKNATWSVDKTDVVELSAASGKIIKVTGLKIGEATITAKVGDKTGTCKVTVKAKTEAETVTIKKDGAAVTELTAKEGDDPITLTAEASKGSAITEWTSSNTNAATVKDGVVTIVGAGTTTITAKVTESIKASVKLNITTASGVLPYTPEMKDKPAKEDNGKFIYWSESAINGGADRVDNIQVLEADGKANIDIQYHDHYANWYSFQIFRSDSAITVNELYRLTLDITADVTGKVTLNGEQIDLTAKTKKTVEQIYNPGEICFSFQAGYQDVASGAKMFFGGAGNGDNDNSATIKIQNIKWENVQDQIKKLTAPTFSVDGSNVITINEVEAEKANVARYELAFFQEDSQKATVAVESGKAIDVSMIKNGTYTVKIRAVGKNKLYTDSDWQGTDPATTVTVNNETVKEENLPFGGGEDTKKSENLGKYMVWYNKDASWNVHGAIVTADKITQATTNANGEITVEFVKIDGNTMFDNVQVVYSADNLLNGGAVKDYVVTLKVNASKDCKLTIARTIVDIKAGDNNVEVAVSAHGLGQYDAAFDIFFGPTDGALIEGGKFVFSDIKFKLGDEVAKTALTAPTALAISDANAVSFTAPASTTGIKEYDLGFFPAEATDPAYTIKVAKSGDTIDVSAIAAGTYTVKIRSVSGDFRYTTSDWSTDTASFTSTIENPVVKVDFGEQQNNGTYADGTWYYWASRSDWGMPQTTINGDITVTDGKTLNANVSTAAGDCTYAFQLFYKAAATEQAKGNAKLTITATQDVSLTANGTAVNLTANTAQEVTIALGANNANTASIALVFNTPGLSDLGITIVYEFVEAAA